MARMVQQVQKRVKLSSVAFLTFFLKVFSGSILGLTLALILQEILGFESFSFLLILVTVTLLFLRASRGWRIVGVLVFDLIAVLTALLIRMYILMAPGA